MSDIRLRTGLRFQTRLLRNRVARIISFDENVVLYDQQLLGEWISSAALSKDVFFSKISTRALLASNPEFDSVDIYPESTLEVIRPHLPVSLFREKNLNWEDISAVKDLQGIFDDILYSEVGCDSLYVYPFGPKRGKRKPVLIQSSNHTPLKWGDVVLRCSQIQNAIFTESVGGIGLYRLGVTKRVPCYMISDYTMNEYPAYFLPASYDWKDLVESALNPGIPAVQIFTTGKPQAYKIIVHYEEVLPGQTDVSVRIKGKEVLRLPLMQRDMILDLSAYPRNYFSIHFLLDGKENFSWPINNFEPSIYPAEKSV